MKGNLGKKIRLVSVLVLQSVLANAGNVALIKADVIGQSSFDSGGNWDQAQPPDASNDYFVEGNPEYFLRTPVSPGNFTFGGHALTFAGGTLLLKATGESTFTFNGGGLVLNGGGIRNANNPVGTLSTIAGLLTVGPKGGSLLLNEGCIDFTAEMTLNGPLSTQNWRWVSPKFSGPVAFGPEGKLVAAESTTLVQTMESVFTFDIGAPETSYLTGRGGSLLKGSFVFKLGPEDLVPGNRWKIVGTVKKEFQDSFSVAGFQKVPGLWTSNDGKYQFSEQTGILSVVGGSKSAVVEPKPVMVGPKTATPALQAKAAESKAVEEKSVAAAPNPSKLAFGLVCVFGVMVVAGIGVLIVMLVRSFKS